MYPRLGGAILPFVGNNNNYCSNICSILCNNICKIVCNIVCSIICNIFRHFRSRFGLNFDRSLTLGCSHLKDIDPSMASLNTEPLSEKSK